MKICLVRHGETDWNQLGKLQGRQDIPLNDVGVAQAAQVAAFLATGEWHGIITSPLARAKQTAHIIARALNLAVREDAGFLEQDYGKASGMTLAQRKQAYPGGRYEGMEPWAHVQDRTWKSLQTHACAHPNQNLIIVSHGGAINSLLARLTNDAVGTGENRLKNACITMLTNCDGALALGFYNQTAAELLQKQDH